MLLRVQPSVLGTFRATPDRIDAPVRPFPQTWSTSGVVFEERDPLFILTEEFSGTSLLVTPSPTASFGEFLSATEDRILRYLDFRQHQTPNLLIPITIIPLNDPRMERLHTSISGEVQRLRRTLPAGPSSQEIATLEWDINHGEIGRKVQADRDAVLGR